jgi:hypothetical protein
MTYSLTNPSMQYQNDLDVHFDTGASYFRAQATQRRRGRLLFSAVGRPPPLMARAPAATNLAQPLRRTDV